ncbi:hypothetical protein B0H21DRAFT_709053 [Amylocystis lapponica]|nr:hypothetical protein B0H21DRAFT_709053 [Amylocystis lapponica]
MSEEYKVVVLNVQGFLVAKNFPPITHKPTNTYIRLPKHINTAKQTVSISRLGCPEFDDSVKGLLALYNMLRRRHTGVKLDNVTPDQQNGMMTLQFWNCYFSSEKQLKNDVQVTQEQKMLFMVLYIGGISSTEIKLEHLVELQVTLSAMPISKRKFKILHCLHSVCILDSVIVTDAKHAAINTLMNLKPMSIQMVKHKVGYWDDEEMEDTHIQFKKIHLTDDDAMSM